MNKWLLYESAKKTLRLREMDGEELDWDQEMAKIISELKL